MLELCISIFDITLFWKLVKETLIHLLKIKLDVCAINFDFTALNEESHLFTIWVAISLISAQSHSSTLPYNKIWFYVIKEEILSDKTLTNGINGVVAVIIRGTFSQLHCRAPLKPLLYTSNKVWITQRSWVHNYIIFYLILIIELWLVSCIFISAILSLSSFFYSAFTFLTNLLRLIKSRSKRVHFPNRTTLVL